MPKKIYNVKPSQTKDLIADIIDVIHGLAEKFSNQYERQAFYSCCNLLRTTPRDVDMSTALLYYSKTMRSRRPGKFYCFMSAATTILTLHYWLHFHEDDKDYNSKHTELKRACGYLTAISLGTLDQLEIVGDIREGYLLIPLKTS